MTLHTGAPPVPATSPPAASRPASGQLAVAVVLAAGAALAMVPGGYRPLDLRAELVLAVVSASLVSLAALRLITMLPAAAGGIARWRLGPWYLLWGTLAFGIASLTWLGPQSGSAERVALSSVLDALSVFTVAVVIWTAGYLASPPRAVRRSAGAALAFALRGTGPGIRTGGIAWLLYGVGSLARLVSVWATGRLGYVGDPSQLVSQAGPFTHALRIVSTFTLFAVAVAAYQAFTVPSTRTRLTLVVLLAAEVVVGALAGGKQSFVLSILAVLIPYGAVRGRLNTRILVAGALLFLWIAVPFNLAYRQVVRGEESTLTPSAAVAAAPEVLSGVVNSESIGVTIADSATTILYRIREIDNVAIITQLTPSVIPYRNPVDFAAAPVVGVIPRAVWPDKPLLTTGYQFSQEYYGLPSNVYTSSALTPLGDLYRHGGWLTVAVGMLLLGGCCRLFDGVFRPERDPRAVFFLLVFLPMVVKAETDIYGLLVSLPSGLVTALLGVHLICRSPGRAGRPPSAGRLGQGHAAG